MWTRGRAETPSCGVRHRATEPQIKTNIKHWAKLLTHGLVILTKFHYNWAKIVDFLLLNIFWARVIFFVTVSMLHSLNYLNLRLFRMFEACLDIDLYEKAAFLTQFFVSMNQLFAIFYRVSFQQVLFFSCLIFCKVSTTNQAA